MLINHYWGTDMKKKLFISESVGAAAIFSAATLLHFVYALSDGATLAIIFGAVNESVWEHVKIFTISYCGYAILQLLWIKPPFRRYIAAKCAGLYFLGGGMIGFFYLYTSITGRSVAAVDVISSAVLVIAAQMLSYSLTVGRFDIGELYHPALMLIMLYYLMFFSFTVFPPKTELFRDHLTGGYGIPESLYL